MSPTPFFPGLTWKVWQLRRSSWRNGKSKIVVEQRPRIWSDSSWRILSSDLKIWKIWSSAIRVAHPAYPWQGIWRISDKDGKISDKLFMIFAIQRMPCNVGCRGQLRPSRRKSWNHVVFIGWIYESAWMPPNDNTQQHLNNRDLRFCAFVCSKCCTMRDAGSDRLRVTARFPSDGLWA